MDTEQINELIKAQNHIVEELRNTNLVLVKMLEIMALKAIPATPDQKNDLITDVLKVVYKITGKAGSDILS